MRKGFIAFFIAMLILVQTLQGVVPRKWEIRSKDEFLKGKFDGISLSDDGILSLSPKEGKIEGPAEEFYLSLLITPEGVAYMGTGHGGKIYRIGKDGKTELYCQVPEMDVYCLALDKKGVLYAGTSPNGKIYKITAKDKRDVFFNPQEKYIWDLLFTEKGFLLAAVGESGGIYKINRQGEGGLILEAEENHILCMKMGKNGDLFAGSGGKGLLYRILQGKNASILFESPHEEIKSIALDEKGNIYAAAGGIVTKPEEIKEIPLQTRAETDIKITVTPSSVTSKDLSSMATKQPSTLYKINPEGIAKKLWHSKDELIYSLIWDRREKRLIFGTGNKGRIYALDRDEKISLLVQKNSEQVYYLLPSNSKIYILSNNPSNLNLLYPEQRFDGEYLSRVLDAKILSSWGRIRWEAVVPSGTNLQFQTRSGNSRIPNKTWSNWSPPYQKKQGEQILNPKARYIQFKIIFKTQSGKVSPRLQRVSIFYLQTNIAPSFTKLELLPANVVFLKPPEQQEIIWGADIDFPDQAENKVKAKTLVMAKKVQRKGFQTVIWEAADENEDNLIFSLYIRGDDESRWRVLKEKWIGTIFAFDTLSFPDGVYFIKIVASDILSNPLGVELKSDKISRPLFIDNSLPVVRNFQAVKEKNKLTVTFSAEDSISHIEEVRYLIRPNEWTTVFPVDGICDSKRENFSITVNLAPNSDNLITIKVKDCHHNVGVYRHTF